MAFIKKESKEVRKEEAPVVTIIKKFLEPTKKDIDNPKDYPANKAGHTPIKPAY